jgi:hypothetical protein
MRCRASGPDGRLRGISGAALLCLSILIAACGQASSAAVPASPQPTASPPSTQPSADEPSAADLLSPAAAGERLTGALTVLRAGYTFDTTLTVGGQVAAHVSGRRLGDASELTIESGGVPVSYRIIPPRSWILDDGGEWVEAEGDAPGGDPLAALLEPSDLEPVSTSDGTVKVRAVYPATELGLAGRDPVTVTITLGPDGTVSAMYATTVNGSEAVSGTVLQPAPDQDPILAPAASAAPSG